MRLNEFVLPEKFDHEQIKEFNDALPFIEKNCSIALTAMKATNKLLFRGSHHLPFKILIGQTENNRQPRDTKITYQRAIDRRLRAFGFKALLSNSIFVTASHMEARLYGKLFVIFPINGCNYTWSSEYSDLTTDLGIQVGKPPNAAQEILDKTFTNEEFIAKYGFKKDNLKEALSELDKGSREIYLSGKYVSMPFSYTNAYLIDNWVGRKHDHLNWFSKFANNAWPDAHNDNEDWEELNK